MSTWQRHLRSVLSVSCSGSLRQRSQLGESRTCKAFGSAGSRAAANDWDLCQREPLLDELVQSFDRDPARCSDFDAPQLAPQDQLLDDRLAQA